MAAGELVIEATYERIVLHRLSATTQTAFERLVYPGESARELASQVSDRGAPGELARFVFHLQHLVDRGALQITVSSEEGPLATLEPTSPSFTLRPVDVADGRYVLSRFALVRRVDDVMVLETPLAAARVVLHDPRLASVLCHFATPIAAADACATAGDLDAESVIAGLNLLASSQLLTRAIDDEGRSAEDESESLRLWEFHDLVFHARSRQGRRNGPYGATYRGLESGPQPPALPEAPAGETIHLARPDLARLEREDPPFARVAERRRSLREFGREPMSAEQLGEFLYRVARVKEQFTRTVELPGGEVTMDFAARPYPTAGALYVLETYLVVNRCRGLDAGMYYHDPLQHYLRRLTAPEPFVKRLLGDAAHAVGIQADSLQVLLVLSARFPRVAWKYSGLAYAAVLKDVGVLFQSMYLAATAMELAPCALGAGNSDTFAHAIGSDYYAETSVGEFVLGSCPERPADAPPEPNQWTMDDRQESAGVASGRLRRDNP